MSRSWCSPSCERLFAGRPQVVGVGVGVGEGDLEEGPLAGERGAQFVGGVGDEVTLRLERGFEAPEEVVEGLAELGELVFGAVEAEAAVEVGGGDLLCGSVHGAERAKEPAGDPPGALPARSTTAINADERRSDVEWWPNRPVRRRSDATVERSPILAGPASR